jgi:hypothetical protein
MFLFEPQFFFTIIETQFNKWNSKTRKSTISLIKQVHVLLKFKWFDFPMALVGISYILIACFMPTIYLEALEIFKSLPLLLSNMFL